MSVWVWVEVEGFRDCLIYRLGLWSCWFRFLIQNLSSHMNLTSVWFGNCKHHQLILLDLPMPLFNFLALEVTAVLSGKCFSVIILRVLILMNIFAHKISCTQFGKHWPPLLIGYGTGRCLEYGWDWSSLLCPTKQDTKEKKNSHVQSHKDRPTLALVVYMTSIDKLKHVMIYKSLCPKCLEDGCQHIVCGGLQTKQPIWHQMYLRVGGWASMYIQVSKMEGVFNYGQFCYSFP